MLESNGNSRTLEAVGMTELINMGMLIMYLNISSILQDCGAMFLGRLDPDSR